MAAPCISLGAPDNVHPLGGRVMLDAKAIAALKEIKSWKLEAADEDSARYFYPLSGIESIEDGSVAYVIGRKGSGKTAIAEYIQGLRNYNVFVTNLSFKSFPFNDIYKLADAGFTRPSQYTTIWKFIIYNAVCAMMARNATIDPSISAQLSAHFNVDLERALARNLTKMTDKGGGFTILGTGATATAKSVVVSNDASWSERVNMLEDIIDMYIDESTYYILFDELDEDYKDIFDENHSAQYQDLLIGLFKAVQDIRRKLSGRRNVRPIVFLREDIFDQLRDNDRNKWEDYALTLSWTEGQLQQLVAFRISRALQEDGPILSVAEAFRAIFTTEDTRAGGTRTRRHVFKYVLSRTLMRPRDVISYFRECATVALDEKRDRISPEMFGASEKKYSSRLRKEFVDEIQSAVPYIDDVFEILSKMRKQTFWFSQFELRYNNYCDTHGIVDKVSFNIVCQILFHYSALGNQPAQRNAKIFKYVFPEAKINFGESGIIHIGLLKSLQIH